MATLFYEPFQNTNNWVGRNGGSTSINLISDPKNQYNMVAYLANNPVLPDTFSTVISNSYKSFTMNFDYLGLPKSASIAINLGCIISISDGGSLSDITIAYAGSVKNSIPPTCSDKFIGPSDWTDKCSHNGPLYYKYPTFISLSDDSSWHHYSITFSTNNQNIRVALNDFGYSNYPESNTAGDCYFTNILITDSYGPSPFIATSAPENFRSISVDALNQVADTVSYANSNAAVNINLGSNTASGGYAAGDVLNDIVNIVGSNYNDALLGNGNDNILTGGDGNDTLTAGVGNDTLIGGNGNDTFVITTEVTTATISDFNILSDIIDLRLFTNLSSLDTIKNAAQYLNGNTVIRLSNTKNLIINGINYNDLQEGNFAITTLAPTRAPTPIPSLTPTSAPTTPIPSFTPTSAPTTPTVSPTTAYPTNQPTSIPSALPTLLPTTTRTVSPTTAYPTNKPTPAPSALPTLKPTSEPTVSPTPAPSALPTLKPTSKPTVSPTTTPIASPTPAPTPLNVIKVEKGGKSYFGTAASDDFEINTSLAVSVTGGGGIDKFTIFPNIEVTYTITDFNYLDEQIDLTAFTGIHKKSDFSVTDDTASSALINLPNNQVIKLLNLSSSQLTRGNFILLATSSPTVLPTSLPTVLPTSSPTVLPTSSPTLLPTPSPTVALGSISDSSTSSALDFNKMLLVAIGGGVVLLGGIYCICAARQHAWPFNSYHPVSLQQLQEDKVREINEGKEQEDGPLEAFAIPSAPPESVVLFHGDERI